MFDNARWKNGVKPAPFPPVYDPSIVADAIGFAAEHTRREIVVGGAAEGMMAMNRMSERLLDRYLLQGDLGLARPTPEVSSIGRNPSAASATNVSPLRPVLKTGAVVLSMVTLGALWHAGTKGAAESRLG